MKIATFNANSIRVRLPIVLDWLAANDPDVLGIQETKCEDHVFPKEAFEEIGYQVAFHGQKSYNGVALVTKVAPTGVRTGFGDPTMPEDCRLITARCEDVLVINSYVPNGTKVGGDKWEYKLRWLDRFADFLTACLAQGQPVVWMGDINIAPTPDDVYDSAKVLGGVGHHPDEFSRLSRIVDGRLVDCFRKHTAGAGHYTYWDFFIRNALDRKLGWRIDHIYASPNLAERCTSCVIDTEPRRADRPSDHTFVMAEFN